MKCSALVVALLLAACSHLPTIEPGRGMDAAAPAANCRSPFATGRWQLVHAIRARLDGGRQAVFTGVVVLSSVDPSIHCVLMTLEGMVLFDAVDDGTVAVRRAFGPFDNDRFATGVMADIRLMFLEPPGGVVAAGRFDDGTPGCRFRPSPDRIVDLTHSPDGGWRLVQYDPRGEVRRTVTAGSAGTHGFPARMTLDAVGRRSYRLALELVDAVKLP